MDAKDLQLLEQGLGMDYFTLSTLDVKCTYKKWPIPAKANN